MGGSEIKQTSDRIGAYPTMLETSGCARSLDWSRRRLMPVISHRNHHHVPRSAVIQGVTVKAPG